MEFVVTLPATFAYHVAANKKVREEGEGKSGGRDTSAGMPLASTGKAGSSQGRPIHALAASVLLIFMASGSPAVMASNVFQPVSSRSDPATQGKSTAAVGAGKTATDAMRFAVLDRPYICKLFLPTAIKADLVARVFFSDGVTVEQWLDGRNLALLKRGIWRSQQRSDHDAISINEEVSVKGDQITVIGEPRATEYFTGDEARKDPLYIHVNVSGGRTQNYMGCALATDPEGAQKLRNIADRLLKDSAALRQKREGMIAESDARKKDIERLMQMDPYAARAIVAAEIAAAPRMAGCQVSVLEPLRRKQMEDSIQMEKNVNTMQGRISQEQIKANLKSVYNYRFFNRHELLVKFGCARDPFGAR